MKAPLLFLALLGVASAAITRESMAAALHRRARHISNSGEHLHAALAGKHKKKSKKSRRWKLVVGEGKKKRKFALKFASAASAVKTKSAARRSSHHSSGGADAGQHDQCIAQARAHFPPATFHVAPQAKDGTCFFHSITKGLTGRTNGGHESAAANPYSRAALVAHLASAANQRAAPFGRPTYPGDTAKDKMPTPAGWTNYLADLATGGYWAGEWEAAAEARWHNIEIVLIDPNVGLFRQYNEGAARRVVVCRVNGNHFDAIVPNGGAHHDAAAAPAHAHQQQQSLHAHHSSSSAAKKKCIAALEEIGILKEKAAAVCKRAGNDVSKASNAAFDK